MQIADKNKIEKQIKRRYIYTLKPIISSDYVSSNLKEFIKIKNNIEDNCPDLYLSVQYFFGEPRSSALADKSLKFDYDKILNLAITKQQKMILAEILNTHIIVFDNQLFGEWVYDHVPKSDTKSIFKHYQYCFDIQLNRNNRLKDNLAYKPFELSDYEVLNISSEKIMFITIFYLYMALYYCYVAITQNDFQALFYAQTYLYSAKQESYHELNFLHTALQAESRIQKSKLKSTSQGDNDLRKWIHESVKAYIKKLFDPRRKIHPKTQLISSIFNGSRVILNEEELNFITHSIWNIGYLNQCYQLGASSGIKCYVESSDPNKPNKKIPVYYKTADDFYIKKGYEDSPEKLIKQLLEQEDVFKTLKKIIDNFVKDALYVVVYDIGEMSGKMGIGELR